MKILHVFTNMNYVYNKAFIDLFKRFDKYNQDYLICDSKENVYKFMHGYDNIQYLNSNSIRSQVFKISRIEKNYDYIIYHFLPNDPFIHLYYNIFSSKLNKVVWRIWGADLYNWRCNIALLNLIRERTRKKIPYVAIQNVDISEYKKQFGNTATLLPCLDSRGYTAEKLKNNFCVKDDNYIYILVGHSAVESDNHEIVLKNLSRFKDKKIRIVLPLNYGNPSYRNFVIDLAHSLFNDDQLMIITERMELDDYIALLWKCDISVFHVFRQIAEGNIIMLMYMRKKIYIPSDSVLDSYYRIENGLEIHDSTLLDSIDFDELIKQESYENNYLFAEHNIDPNTVVDDWDKVFKRLKNELEKEIE